MRKYDYDLIVIGAGPAGEKGAAAAAFFGKKVLIVEKSSQFGGAISATGVPEKAMRETSLYFSSFRQRDLHGIDLSFSGKPDTSIFMRRGLDLRDGLGGWVKDNLEHHGIDTQLGEACFLDPHTIEVSSDDGTLEYTAEKFLIATGSRPVRPSYFPWGSPHIFDSDSVLSMGQLPDKLLVVGGGTIGCEYACIFRSLGMEVTLIHSHDTLFPFADGEIARIFQSAMLGMGVNVIFSDRVMSVTQDEGIELHLESGATQVGDAVLVTVGRSSVVERLGLENAGVMTGDRGIIPVNEWFQTNVGHIYAAGDVVGFPALSSSSMEQGRTAMAHAFQFSDDTKLKSGAARLMPFGVWTIPEISMVGETEESCIAQGIPYAVGRARYSDNPRGMITGEKHGLVKLIFRHPDRQLIGAHIIGEQACELIGVGLVAMTSNATADTFMNTCFNYPSLADMFKYATYDALTELRKRDQELL